VKPGSRQVQCRRRKTIPDGLGASRIDLRRKEIRWYPSIPQTAHAVDKNRPPLSTGARLPWFSRVRAFLAADRPGAVGRKALGEGCCGLMAAPRRSKEQHPGVVRLPGPPNCFPSSARALC
jgi:hypothetical protein